jgi:hypothetical protein
VTPPRTAATAAAWQPYCAWSLVSIALLVLAPLVADEFNRPVARAVSWRPVQNNAMQQASHRHDVRRFLNSSEMIEQSCRQQPSSFSLSFVEASLLSQTDRLTDSPMLQTFFFFAPYES